MNRVTRIILPKRRQYYKVTNKLQLVRIDLLAEVYFSLEDERQAGPQPIYFNLALHTEEPFFVSCPSASTLHVEIIGTGAISNNAYTTEPRSLG